AGWRVAERRQLLLDPVAGRVVRVAPRPGPAGAADHVARAAGIRPGAVDVAAGPADHRGLRVAVMVVVGVEIAAVSAGPEVTGIAGGAGVGAGGEVGQARADAGRRVSRAGQVG